MDTIHTWFLIIEIAHFLHSGTCPKTFFWETDNSSIWF